MALYLMVKLLGSRRRTGLDLQRHHRQLSDGRRALPLRARRTRGAPPDREGRCDGPQHVHRCRARGRSVSRAGSTHRAGRRQRQATGEDRSCPTPSSDFSVGRGKIYREETLGNLRGVLSLTRKSSTRTSRHSRPSCWTGRTTRAWARARHVESERDGRSELPRQHRSFAARASIRPSPRRKRAGTAVQQAANWSASEVANRRGPMVPGKEQASSRKRPARSHDPESRGQVTAQSVQATAEIDDKGACSQNSGASMRTWCNRPSP